jgi:hypothetical protein
MKLLALLLLILGCNAGEMWIQLEKTEVDQVKGYLEKLVKIGESGKITEYLSLKYGPKFDNLETSKKTTIIEKAKADISDDILKVKAAIKSTELCWHIKPAIIQIQFTPTVNGEDSVLVIGNKPEGKESFFIMGYKNKYKSP